MAIDMRLGQRAGGQRLHLNALHGQWLHRLREYYDLVCASTWEADANGAIAPLIAAPDDLPFIRFTERDCHDWTWKLPAIQRFVRDRPAVWLDDDLGEDADAWALARTMPALLIRPDGYVGWTRAEYEQLIDIARSLA